MSERTTSHSPPAAEPTGEAIDETGDRERERLRREVAELRRQVQRLAIELQIERERSRHVDTPIGTGSGNGSGAGLDTGAPPLPLRPLVERWRHGQPAIETLRSLAERAGSRARRIVAEPRDGAATAAWTRFGRWEAAAFCAIALVALVVRFYDLSDLPRGFHGDEATAGLLGRQIAREGWIGTYTNLMAGSPLGFYYVVGLAMAVIPDEVFAIRFVAALSGLLTVVVLFALMRRSFGVPAALAGAAFLATMGWHIHFSRLGFPTISWPLAALVVLLALVEAFRTGDRRWWGAAGALAGLGLFTYNSHVLLLGIVGPVIAVLLFGWSAIGAAAALGLYAVRPGLLTLVLLAAALAGLLASRRFQDRRRVTQALVFGAAFLLGGLPMLRYMADDANNYFGYGRRLSVFNTQEWAASRAAGDEIAFLIDRYVEYWDRLCCHPQINGVDSTGVTPLVPLPLLLLAAVGLAVSLRRRDRLAGWLGALVVLVMPLASALSTDFAMRRSLVVAVFLAMLAGIAVVEAAGWAIRRGWATRIGVLALVALLTSLSVYRNLDNYFGTTLNSQAIRWTLAVESVEASTYLDDLPEDAYVYYFSDRWSWNHEIRRFFAPNARGEDRGQHFGAYDFAIDPARGRPVFLFLDRYRDDAAIAEARYPGGETIVAGDPAHPDYVVYLPPETVQDGGGASDMPAATPTIPVEGRG